MKEAAVLYREFRKRGDLGGLKEFVRKDPALQAVYPDSLHEVDETLLFLLKRTSDKVLVAVGSSSVIFEELDGEAGTVEGYDWKECPLTPANSGVIRKYFEFARPVPLLRQKSTVGLGDRLGLASPGHIGVVRKYDVRPVLAQQSIRELTLTGRDFDGVLADATWAVFQEDYRGGYGADGDHLKSLDEVKLALNSGYTIITLDCSEYIQKVSADTPAPEIARLYEQIDRAERERIEKRFLDKEFRVDSGLSVSFSEETLRLNCAIYQKAVNFAIHVYQEAVAPKADSIDFEVSIDETATPTSPEAHFFVASQLIDAGVKVATVAPRFCGEFQKGIDYIGNLKDFEREFEAHARIADHFGYKLSIHSGSDKFRVFPTIGEKTKGRVHVKTAGTNWLEAVKVVIAAEPELYREIHAYALKKLPEARKYYHITINTDEIPDVTGMRDEDLPELMEKPDSRQLIHVTYGAILQAKDENGRFLFRDRIYQCLHENEALYREYLGRHIGRHLTDLGFRETANT